MSTMMNGSGTRDRFECGQPRRPQAFYGLCLQIVEQKAGGQPADYKSMTHLELHSRLPMRALQARHQTATAGAAAESAIETMEVK